ncbi:MAG: glycosyltransferase family 39 protein [Phycisphaerae bacterium]|nr:glycosyltransferase family 39 protein [Phycisphaerae bacterium]
MSDVDILSTASADIPLMSPANTEPSPHSSWRRRLAVGTLIVAIVVVYVATRLPSIGFQPINIDESIHAAAAVRCSAMGTLPYVGAVGNKGPLQYWAYQGLFRVAGDYNVPAAHAVGAVIVACNAIFVALIASRCFGPYAGPWAALLYLLAMGTSWDYLSFNSEMPASLPLVVAGWLILAAPNRISPIRCVIAGTLVMVAAGFRQNCLAVLPIMAVAAGVADWAKDRRVLPAVARAFLVGLGGLVPVAVVVTVYARHAALADLAFGYFGHNVNFYMGAIAYSPGRLLYALWDASVWINHAAVVMMLAIAGFVPIAFCVRISDGRAGHEPAFAVPRVRGAMLAILTLSLWAAETAGLRFFNHYRMLDWPFTAVLAAGGWALLLGQLRHRPTRVAFRVGVIAAMVAMFLRGESLPYVAGRVDPIFARIDVQPHVSRVALRLRENTTPDESLFVWGMEPQVYLIAQRRMATRFAHCSPQVGLIQFENYYPLEQDRSAWVWPSSFEQMMADLRADPPAYVVDASEEVLFGAGQYPIRAFDELAEWLDAGYVRDFEDVSGTLHRVIVYRRNDRPPTSTTRPVSVTLPGRPRPSEF